METHGTPVARTNRMRERPVSNNASAQPVTTSTEVNKPVEEPVNPASAADDGLDKYDISTLACTD